MKKIIDRNDAIEELVCKLGPVSLFTVGAVVWYYKGEKQYTHSMGYRLPDCDYPKPELLAARLVKNSTLVKIVVVRKTCVRAHIAHLQARYSEGRDCIGQPSTPS